jgi:hypothetical protein
MLSVLATAVGTSSTMATAKVVLAESPSTSVTVMLKLSGTVSVGSNPFV